MHKDVLCSNYYTTQHYTTMNTPTILAIRKDITNKKFYSKKQLKLFMTTLSKKHNQSYNTLMTHVVQYLHFSSIRRKFYFDTDKTNSKYKRYHKILTQKKITKQFNKEDYTITERYDKQYGPYGTQWVHDTQTDDKLNDKLINRKSIFNKLRNITLPEQRSPAWFEMRRHKLTASDIGSLLGLSKYNAPYTVILKKIEEPVFQSNKFCYHGKMLEEPATMIYEYRMNVKIDEFGLMGHPKHNFLGASPDGICTPYKLNKRNKSIYVGRMLEIKCPYSRRIIMDGPIVILGDTMVYENGKTRPFKPGVEEICPKHYWAQVQLQLECCNLEYCDFWQCNIKEYDSRDQFIQDTSVDEPFRSKETGFEKGCLIQLLPKKRINDTDEDYWGVVYEDASFIYPKQIEMSPTDCDIWIGKQLAELKDNPIYQDRVFDKVVYWKLYESKNVTVKRDKQWFADSLPEIRKMWNNIIFLRKHPTKCKLYLDYVHSRKRRMNKDLMRVIEKVCNPKTPKEYFTTLQEKINSSPKKLPKQTFTKPINSDKYLFESDTESSYDIPTKPIITNNNKRDTDDMFSDSSDESCEEPTTKYIKIKRDTEDMFNDSSDESCEKPPTKRIKKKSSNKKKLTKKSTKKSTKKQNLSDSDNNDQPISSINPNIPTHSFNSSDDEITIRKRFIKKPIRKIKLN